MPSDSALRLCGRREVLVPDRNPVAAQPRVRYPVERVWVFAHRGSEHEVASAPRWASRLDRPQHPDLVYELAVPPSRSDPDLLAGGHHVARSSSLARSAGTGTAAGAIASSIRRAIRSIVSAYWRIASSAPASPHPATYGMLSPPTSRPICPASTT